MDEEITPDELAGLLDADESVAVVDIRTATAFSHGHIPGSENVPFEELPQRVEEFDDADRIVTVCPHGKASLKAAWLFQSAESTDDAAIQSLAGGLDAWDGDLEAATVDDGTASSGATTADETATNAPF
ncbi:rhodanese-like domain-containing protein [Halococcus saccharolyticus]|uniref:Rhodanese-like protein n=1 Tax=Halococcus saccharolyticus DSM 5350 TaxID=1227455 RepID=M0MIF0_9EURY|nr:rhodanese-like domain-containing protein [Halococcus saccharolyticus]EMA44225.1 Rhodanese-like protein [Halococcus saccharolyticus DSM 5350]